jgi:hypothetical protein
LTLEELYKGFVILKKYLPGLLHKVGTKEINKIYWEFLGIAESVRSFQPWNTNTRPTRTLGQRLLLEDRDRQTKAAKEYRESQYRKRQEYVDVDPFTLKSSTGNSNGGTGTSDSDSEEGVVEDEEVVQE